MNDQLTCAFFRATVWMDMRRGPHHVERGTMMRKRLLVLWVSLLCACGLALPACGSSGSADAGAGETQKEAAQEEAQKEVEVDPAEEFYGTWKMAAMQTQNVTVAGDFSQFIDSEGGATLTIVIEKGGTGTISFGDETSGLTWEMTDGTMVVKPDKEADADGEADDANEATDDATDADTDTDDAGEEVDADDGGGVTNVDHFDCTYADGRITAKWSDGETESAVILTADGTLPDVPEIDMAQATDFTSMDELVGTWKISKMKMAEAIVYGEPDDLAQLYGDEAVNVLEIGEDGAATFMGQECAVDVEEDGAIIDVVIYQIPIKRLGDDLAVDMSDFVGSDAVFCFSK